MIEYIPRSKAYYSAQGYAPYNWAAHDRTPFTLLRRPLAESRLVLVTTAAPFRADIGDQGPNAPYNAAAKFFEVFTQPIDPTPDLRISHIGYDRVHCRADDYRTWLPIPALQQAQATGTYRSLAERLIGVPTNRSQRITQDIDAPSAVAAAKAQGADVALLVPT